MNAYMTYCYYPLIISSYHIKLYSNIIKHQTTNIKEQHEIEDINKRLERPQAIMPIRKGGKIHYKPTTTHTACPQNEIISI